MKKEKTSAKAFCMDNEVVASYSNGYFQSIQIHGFTTDSSKVYVSVLTVLSNDNRDITYHKLKLYDNEECYYFLLNGSKYRLNEFIRTNYGGK